MQAKRAAKLAGYGFLVLLAATLVGAFVFIPFSQEPPYEFVKAWGGQGEGPGQFSDPTGIAVAGGEVFVAVFVPINLNTASREEILLVPGVGARMAHEFEEYRPYRALAQFRREMGKYVDDDEVTRFERYVFVPIHLNTASDEEILPIPGLGGRMLHEFKEYRPYRALAQFRREIGKYVDDDEVARFERYVVLE